MDLATVRLRKRPRKLGRFRPLFTVNVSMSIFLIKSWKSGFWRGLKSIKMNRLCSTIEHVNRTQLTLRKYLQSLHPRDPRVITHGILETPWIGRIPISGVSQIQIFTVSSISVWFFWTHRIAWVVIKVKFRGLNHPEANLLVDPDG